MSFRNRFPSRSDDDVIRLVTEHPLAWLFSRDEEGPYSIAAPLRPQVCDGRLTGFVGHVPRASRLAAAGPEVHDVLALFLGPHGYISPSWFSDRTQAPTWNFASTQVITDIEFVDDPEFLVAHLRDLVRAMEQGRDAAWSVDEMGSRFDRLAERVIGFAARLREVECRFKLGQDEPDTTLAEIYSALEDSGNDQLLALMQRFNADRRAG